MAGSRTFASHTFASHTFASRALHDTATAHGSGAGERGLLIARARRQRDPTIELLLGVAGWLSTEDY